MEKDYETGSLVPFDFSTIFKRIPEMNLLECEVSVHPFEKPVDSSDMGPNEWRMIAEWIHKNYDAFDGFLILHGTDTMSYTASALSFMLKNLSKPVILTGSQLPIGDLRTDAKENLITASSNRVWGAFKLVEETSTDEEPETPEPKLIKLNISRKLDE